MKYIFNLSKTSEAQARQGVKTFIQNHNDSDLIMALHPNIRNQLSVQVGAESLTETQIDIIVNTIVFSN